MKQCEFPNCEFKTTDDCETLDEKHIYCSCNEIIHLNISYIDRRSGACRKCNMVVEEMMKSGTIIYYRYNKGRNLVSVTHI